MFDQTSACWTAATRAAHPLSERNVRSLALIEAMATSSPRVSLVIPALNEARNLPHVFAQLPRDLYEVVLVDGNSRDGTVEVAKALWPGIRIVRQNRRGKGNALACGFAACRGDIIVMLDADGSTNPAEIPRFIDALVAGADFAKGSRFVEGGGSSDLTRLRRTGNRFLSAVVNALYGTTYSDLCYGYNAFWSGCLPLLGLDPGRSHDGDDERRLWGDGFEVETLINVLEVLRMGGPSYAATTQTTAVTSRLPASAWPASSPGSSGS